MEKLIKNIKSEAKLLHTKYIIKHYIFQEKNADSANCSRLWKKAAANVNYL